MLNVLYHKEKIHYDIDLKDLIGDCREDPYFHVYLRRIDLLKLYIKKLIYKFDKSEQLNTEIHSYDDEALKLTKKLCKGIPKNKFIKLFKSDVDGNISRRAIEKPPKGLLSLSRFKEILNALGIRNRTDIFGDIVPNS